MNLFLVKIEDNNTEWLFFFFLKLIVVFSIDLEIMQRVNSDTRVCYTAMHWMFYKNISVLIILF
jgi:hypothetical protein